VSEELAAVFVSNEINNLPLRFHVRFDVALGGGERAMSSQQSERP